MATILSITVRIDKRPRPPRQACDRRYGGSMSTEITVRGSFSAFQPPERGTVNASVAYEGPEMEPVYDRVARDLEILKSSIVPLKDQGTVTWWSADQLRTWSNRPWNDKGKQLPLVHHASVGVEVKFRDFTALSRWVGQHIAEHRGLQRCRRSTGRSRPSGARSSSAEVRTRAVRDAVTRAQQYADALGLGKSRTCGSRRRRECSTVGPDSGAERAYLRAAPAGGGRSPNWYRNTSMCRPRSTRDSRRPRRQLGVGLRHVGNATTQGPAACRLTAAMKSQDKLRTATLRMLLAAIQTEEVAGKGPRLAVRR